MITKQKILHFMPENFVWGGIEVYLQHTLPKLQASGLYEICAAVTLDSPLFHWLKEAGILEFLLQGKPCVTYAAGGISEVMALPEAQDCLVPLGDEAAFARVLVAAINLEDEALATLAPVLQALDQAFDISRHVEKMEAFYDRVFSELEPKKQYQAPHQALFPKTITATG